MALRNDFYQKARKGCVIVAHPDDETLWAGGAILARADWQWSIVTLCRASDAERAGKFAKVLQYLRANGQMADLDDGPEQRPLAPEAVQEAILARLPHRAFDVVLTHGPAGEYTRHRRHEEVCRAVVALWALKQLTAAELWMFAYEDGGRQYLPQARRDADIRETPAESLWLEKYRLITEVYGFASQSWEARTTPHEEAFWRFQEPQRALHWMEGMGAYLEDPRSV